MQPLLPAVAIQERVHALGQTLSAHYAGKPLTVVGVLTGSLVFMADLVRAIEIPHRMGVVHASSYRGKTTAPGDLHVGTELLPDIRGRDVLIIDDIFDTGRTLEKLVQEMRQFEPASIETAVLLLKEGRSRVSFAPHHYGFRIPDAFVVGYGLDYNDDYRHLPYIGVLEASEL